MEKLKHIIERLDVERSVDLAAEILSEINFVTHSDIGKAVAVVEFLLDKIEVLQDESQSNAILLDACKSANKQLHQADQIVRRLAALEDNWLSPMSLIHEARTYITNNPNKEGGEGE